jgi:hypothetical protein
MYMLEFKNSYLAAGIRGIVTAVRNPMLPCDHGIEYNRSGSSSLKKKGNQRALLLEENSLINNIIFPLDLKEYRCAVCRFGFPLTFEQVTRLPSASTTSYERQALEKSPYLWEVDSIPVPQTQPPVQKASKLHIHGL